MKIRLNNYFNEGKSTKWEKLDFPAVQSSVILSLLTYKLLVRSYFCLKMHFSNEKIWSPFYDYLTLKVHQRLIFSHLH